MTTIGEGTQSPTGTPATAVDGIPAQPIDDSAALPPAQAVTVAEKPAASGSPAQQFAKILGAIVAPTTLLTALLYYFGWSHAYWFLNYFGVNSTALGFTSTDYLMRSVDALFVPMTVAATAGLVAVWGHTVLRARLAAGSRPRVLRVLMPVMALAGAVLVIGGFCSVFVTTVLSQHLVAAPLSLGFGVLLLVYTAHLQRFLTAQKQKPAYNNGRGWAAVVEFSVVFVFVGLSPFWAATDYSAAVGRSRASNFVAGLTTYPNVVVYSERSLSLYAPGVHEVRCHDPQAAYRFRYTGLKLMLQSGDQYLFVPAEWTPAKGVAILIPRISSLRLEFFPAGNRPSPEPSAC